MRAVVTVVGADKIGIVAGVTATLAELEANIIEISQTLMSGAFTMMMVVETQNSDFQPFKQNFQEKVKPWVSIFMFKMKQFLTPCTNYNLLTEKN